MSGPRFPVPKPGDAILADHLKVIYEALERLEAVHYAPPLYQSGDTIVLSGRPGFWIRLTGKSGSAYAWTRVYPQAGGTWLASPAPNDAGTTTENPAREINGNATPTPSSGSPLYVRAWYAAEAREVRFQYGSCS